MLQVLTLTAQSTVQCRFSSLTERLVDVNYGVELLMFPTRVAFLPCISTTCAQDYVTFPASY
jgi:hypothetical protein